MATAEYQKKRFDRMMAYAVVKLGGKCVDCGTVDGLHFDHIRGNKLGNISEMANYSLEVFDIELSKCELRCSSCHGHRHNGYAKHGTLSGYRYCKCQKCVEVKRAYMKAYMRKRRARS